MNHLTLPATFVLVAAVLGGCRGARAAAEPGSSSLTVVVEESRLWSPEAVSAVVEAYEGWAREGGRAPGSSFRVTTYAAKASGSEMVRDALVVTIPERWGSNVLARKAAFLKEARALVADLRPGVELRLPSSTSGRADPRGAVRLLTPSNGRERPTLVHLDPGGARVHLVAVCDISNSGVGLACTPQLLRAALHSWSLRAACAPGSTFSVVVVGHSRDTAIDAFSSVVRNAPCGEVLAELLVDEPRVERALGNGKLRGGSAIAEAIHRATTRLAGRTGMRSLLVASDLREVNSRYNFEKAVPSDPSAFASWLRAQSLQIDFSGVEVLVCGVHGNRGPSSSAFTASLARDLDAAWATVFREMGAGAPRFFPECRGTELWEALSPGLQPNGGA